jgi:ferredoxin-NADP reductase
VIEPGETLCFVCGPPALIGDIRPQLMELGVEDDQIRVEQWGSS